MLTIRDGCNFGWSRLVRRLLRHWNDVKQWLGGLLTPGIRHADENVCRQKVTTVVVSAVVAEEVVAKTTTTRHGGGREKRADGRTAADRSDDNAAAAACRRYIIIILQRALQPLVCLAGPPCSRAQRKSRARIAAMCRRA